MLVRSDLTIRLYSTHQALTLLITSFHLGFGPRLLTFLKPISLYGSQNIQLTWSGKRLGFASFRISL